MDDYSENVLKKLCCTCLNRERKLFQLCRIADGINNLYSLLSYDAEAYKEVFYKDAANLHVCWECKAVMTRISAFRLQACSVQKQLTDFAEGRTGVHLNTSLSALKSSTKDTYDLIITDFNDKTDNFIDCGPSSDVDDDIPLSEFHSNSVSDDGNLDENKAAKVKFKKKTKIKSSNNELSSFRYSKYFTTTQIPYKENLEYRDEKKNTCLEAPFKCESCLDVFKTDIALEKHNEDFHTEKENHIQCSICRSYIPEDTLEIHISSHSTIYTCKMCGHTARSINEAINHMKGSHRRTEKKGLKRVPVHSPGFKTRKKTSSTGESTTFGCICPECNKCFETKSKRWKHIQRHHREGYACDKCGKKFAFRNNLNRHVRLHQSPPPREQCTICHKLIRCDLIKVHARIHAARASCACRACNKTFVSRASYEHHLKYTRAHAQGDILKHKCSECDKGYRSRGELRDHVNYQHKGKTQHKCPECGKALATRRCITRHVRRAHRGLQENARDKICQQCGKAFRDKKGLREHEFIHTGERPLSCEICGCTFRQSASLYTHKKRVHKIYPQKKNVQLVDTGDV